MNDQHAELFFNLINLPLNILSLISILNRWTFLTATKLKVNLLDNRLIFSSFVTIYLCSTSLTFH